MFFDDPTIHPQQLLQLLQSSSTVIIALASLPDCITQQLRPTLIIRPNDNRKITIDQARELIAVTQTKQVSDHYYIIEHAETIQPEAENAILKLLEEPKSYYHFILLTTQPNQLLPTIRSRAAIYYPRLATPLSQPPIADAQTITMAKQLLTLSPSQLPDFADKIAKHKDNPRAYAIAIIDTAIELAYKSYFATNKTAFLDKLPQLLQLHEHLQANGHIKLHIVADLC